MPSEGFGRLKAPRCLKAMSRRLKARNLLKVPCRVRASCRLKASGRLKAARCLQAMRSKVTMTLSTRLYFPSPTSWTHFPLSFAAAADPYDNLLSHQLIVGSLFTSRGNDVTLHGILTALHPSHVRCYPLVSCSVRHTRRFILISHSQL